MTYVQSSNSSRQAGSGSEMFAPSISRGVSLHWLRNEFTSELKAYGKDLKSTIHDIENLKEEGYFRSKGANIMCPDDLKLGTAYVDCLVGEDNSGPTSAVLLHSHEWENTVGDIIDSISEHCDAEKLDPKRFYVWADFLCVNLHRISEMKQTTKWNPLVQFVEGLDEIKGICEKGNVKILAVMSPWHNPILLQNTWSIYEMYHFLNETEIDVKFLLPPEESKNMIRSAVFNEDGLNQLLEMVNKMDVSKIDKTQADTSGQECVLELITNGPGVDEVNNWQRDWVLDCLVDEICEVQTIVSDEDVDRLCSQVAPILMQNGSFNQAFRLFQKSLTIRETGNKDSLQMASICQNIGRVLQNMDELDESMTYLKKALVLLKSEHGVYHNDTSECFSSIGDVYYALDDLDKALEMYQMCQSIEEKVRGINHSRTATAFHNIGKVVNDAGRPDEALVYFQQGLAIREEIHGKNNVDVAATYRGIGSAFTNKNDHDEAILNYKNALAICEEIYGDEDAETAICCNSLAMAYCDRHDYEVALPLFKRTVKIYEQTLGKSHSHTKVARESYDQVKKLHEI